MGDNNFDSHVIWENRVLRKQVQVGDKEPEKKSGHKKIFLAVFLIISLTSIFFAGIFLKYDNGQSSEASKDNINTLPGDKSSIFENLFSTKKFKRLTLGAEESVPMSILKFVPDGHISKIEKEGNITLFISAHDKSYMMQGKTFNDLTLLTDANGPKPILKPELSGFDQDYAGFGQVIENPKTHDLIGVYHTEVRVNPDASDSQLTSIALALSKDGGYTWKKMGRIITGQNIASVGTIVSGTGQPSGVIVGDYIYLYFSDWNRLMADSIHLARSPLSENGMPGTWEKYTESGFRQVGLSGKSTPVIVPFDWDKKIYYTANPSISYNTYLKKYLAIFETNIGFFSAISEDGINWGSNELLFEFSKDTTIPKKIGDIWYSYPSLLSTNTQTDMITGETGFLYYGRGVFGQDHQLVRRSFVIQ